MLIQGGQISSGRFRHGLGRRVVLDDLGDIAAADDLAGADGEVLADLEARRVGLPQPQIALAGGDVLGQHLHAAHQVLAVGGDRLAEEFRIGQDEVRGRDRVGDLLHVEARLVACVLVQPVGLVDEIVRPARGDQVDLLQEIEEGVFPPFRVLKALVAAFRHDSLGRFLSGSGAADRIAPDGQIAGEEPRLCLQRPGGIGKPVFCDLGEGLDHVDHGLADEIAEFAALARLRPR